METVVILISPEQRQSAQMLALSLPVMLPQLKEMAAANGQGGLVSIVEQATQKLGMTEDQLIAVIQRIVMAEDVRVTVDGELALRACSVI